VVGEGAIRGLSTGSVRRECIGVYSAVLSFFAAEAAPTTVNVNQGLL